MALIDTIKNAISQTGANALRAITSVNPQLGGKVGKAVDVVGKALGNPFPEAYASEKAQSAGGVAQAQANPIISPIPDSERVVQDKNGNWVAPPSNNNNSGGTTTQRASDSDRAWAQTVLDNMNKGTIIWDDNLRSRANSILSQGNQPAPQPPIGESGVRSAIADTSAGLLSEKDVQALIDKYAGSSRDNANALAAEIENTARENANREYDTVKQALGVQKGEVQTVGEQQRGRVAGQKTLTEQDLAAKQGTETKTIEEQKAAFLDEKTKTTDQLAQNWRDMSLEVQRIMRARGVTDSSYSGDAETKILLDFNKGLRTLAEQTTSAVQDFADAVIETNKFYERQKAQLDFDVNNKIEDIDTWVRQQVQSIQAQENMALTQKLNDIKSAISQGNQLKIQTAQSIADKQFALDSWLLQTNTQYKQAVALAAQNKVADATKTIQNYRDMATKAFDLVTKGGYEFQVVKTADGKNQAVIHGQLPNGQDDYLYLTPQGFDTLSQNVYGSLTKSNDIFGSLGVGGASNVNPDSINAARANAGLPSIGSTSAPTQTNSGASGILSTIANFFK